ncbi:MAG: hypothetical protein WDO13_21870 [Verrucomicrobiota bacterium]
MERRRPSTAAQLPSCSSHEIVPALPSRYLPVLRLRAPRSRRQRHLGWRRRRFELELRHQLGGTPFPNGTSDIATFDSTASINTLGGNITVSSLVVGTAGNVTIADNSNTLTFASTAPISVGAGQSLILNVNTALAAGSSITSLGSGSTLTFGSSSSTTTTSVGNGVLTFNSSGGNVTFASGDTLSFGGSSAGLVVEGGVTVNLDGAVNGTTTGNAIQVLSGSTLNLQSNLSKKIVLGTATGNQSASVFLTASGVNTSSVLQVAGSGTKTSNVFTFGVNISGGGTGTYSGSLSLDNNASGTGNLTDVLSANAGSTANFTGPITGSSKGTPRAANLRRRHGRARRLGGKHVCDLNGGQRHGSRGRHHSAAQ